MRNYKIDYSKTMEELINTVRELRNEVTRAIQQTEKSEQHIQSIKVTINEFVIKGITVDIQRGVPADEE